MSASPLIAYVRAWVPALRLARRDAARHRVRTVLAALLVALPVAALVAGVVASSTAPPARETALASVPQGAQAVVTATAIPRPGPPFPQLPEGAPGPWVDDTAQVPATSEELADLLPAGDRLLPYWNARGLIATAGLPLDAGKVLPAGSGIETVESLDVALVSSATLQEADPEALALLLPALSSGEGPANATEAVITTALADRLGARAGDTVTFIAPPFSGWFSSDGRIGEVVQDSQRSYRISGLVQSEDEGAWAPAGWLSALVQADSAGVDGHYLVIGEEPVTWEDAKQLNEVQAFAVSRHVLTQYPSPDELYPVTVDPGVVLTRLAAVVVAGTVGSLLVIFLVTPAFAVSTEQARRTLGLAAATGAAPRDLRRMISSQGLLIGATGGVLGATVGAVAGGAGLRLLHPDTAVLAHFPWWILPVAVAVAVLLGLVATMLPARWAGRQQPVDALKQRSSRVARADGSPGGRARRIAGNAAGPVLLAIAVGCAVLSLTVPVVLERDPLAAGYAPPISVTVPLVLAMVCGTAGLLLSTHLVLGLGGRVAGRFPLALRAALRDSSDHRSRSVPAAAAVLVAALAASFLVVQTGSRVANERDRRGEFVAPGAIILGAAVPVSNAFDEAVLTDAVDVLARTLPVTGHVPVYSLPRGSQRWLSVGPPPDKGCPPDTYPDTSSAIREGAPLTCVPWERAYSPSMAVPWRGGSDTHVMDGDALRASGLPGAQEAAEVLDAGGAVVNNAALLSGDGTVRVVSSGSPFPAEGDPEVVVTELPGAFVRGFAPPLTVSVQTAQALGVMDLQHVGEYVTTGRPLSVVETARARDVVEEHTTLVQVAEATLPYRWGTTDRLVPVLALAALAVLATTVCLLLARTQSRADLATMHAVGASPRFLRRFTVAQAGVVLAAGLPIGASAGITLGTYLVAWNRRLGVDGAWLETVPLWPVQMATWVAVIGVGVGAAWFLSKPPRSLTRRTAD